MERAIDIPEDSGALKFLYHSFMGRVLLKGLCARRVSMLCGRFCDSVLSRFLIGPFVIKNSIDLSIYEDEEYACFNDCFARRIVAKERPVDMEADHFIAPCDGLLSAYRINDGLVIPAKQSKYSLERLLRNKRVADYYSDGICLVYRLCVNHYHRYCYVDSGIKSKNVHIDGILHTVRPIALDCGPVFTENSREYTLIKTPKFGTVLQMEVGAMLVGKIVNNEECAEVVRGCEKGHFDYGGSTIIILVKKDRLELDENIFEATENGKEIPVKMGECIGRSLRSLR